MKKIISICCIVVGLFSLQAQIVNEGIINIKNGSYLYSNYTFTNKSTATITNNGEIHFKADFINNGTTTEPTNPNTATGKVFFDSATNDVQHISGTNKVSFDNLFVNMTSATAKGVLVADKMELIVQKGITLTAGDLRLKGEAQLLQKHSLASNQNTGNSNLLQDQQGTSNTYFYNYWSSPVSSISNSYKLQDILYDGTDANINDFNPLQVNFITGNNYNGNPAITDATGYVTTPLEINRQWIYKYDNQPINSGSGWAYMDYTGTYSTGLGYTMKGDNATNLTEQNYVFKGKPNDGQYSFTLNANSSSLLGNPYPSAIDANSFITDNTGQFDGTIYYWEHWGGNSHSQQQYQGGYATYTLAGGTPPVSHPLVNGGGTSSGINGSRYIPVGQGFFIESVTGGTVTFKNSQRVFKLESDPDSHFFRTSINDKNTKSTQNNEFQRIRLGYNNPDGFYRQIMVAFIDGTTEGVDYGYDGAMADVNPDEMYWVLNNTPYVINALPYNVNLQLPLGINVVTTGTHRIFIDELENFNDNIFILDTLTNTTTQINDNAFEINLAEGMYLNRFYLVFQPTSALAVNEALQNDINVFYNQNHEIVIKNPKEIVIKDITIYNAIGQIIKKIEKKNINNIETKINIEAANSVYYVVLNTNQGFVSYNILVY